MAHQKKRPRVLERNILSRLKRPSRAGCSRYGAPREALFEFWIITSTCVLLAFGHDEITNLRTIHLFFGAHSPSPTSDNGDSHSKWVTGLQIPQKKNYIREWSEGRLKIRSISGRVSLYLKVCRKTCPPYLCTNVHNAHNISGPSPSIAKVVNYINAICWCQY